MRFPYHTSVWVWLLKCHNAEMVCECERQCVYSTPRVKNNRGRCEMRCEENKSSGSFWSALFLTRHSCGFTTLHSIAAQCVILTTSFISPELIYERDISHKIVDKKKVILRHFQLKEKSRVCNELKNTAISCVE